jgi:hypothetical protein
MLDVMLPTRPTEFHLPQLAQGESRFSEVKARKAKADAERTHVRDQGLRPPRNTEIRKTEPPYRISFTPISSGRKPFF